MPTHLILRDTRLEGTLRTRCRVIKAGKTTMLSSIFSAIRACAAGGGQLETLFILCHGYSGVHERAQVCMDAGGMGLELGREDVLHTNVSRWESIAGLFRNIVVHACAAANTEPANEGTTADGRYLMGALAIHTGATVYAADRMQLYFPDTMDFGDWEGTLWKFPPSGEPPSTATAASTELSAVQ